MKYFAVNLCLLTVLILHGQNIVPRLSWQFQTDGAIRTKIQFAEDNMIVANSAGSVYCIGIKDKETKWVFKSSKGIAADPLVYDGRVYLSTRGQMVLALDLKTGKEVWSFKTGELQSSPSGGWDYFSSGPQQFEDLIIVGSGDGNVYAMDRERGKLRWKFSTQQRVRATSRIEDGVVYQPSNDGFVYALEAGSGKLIWKFETLGASYDSQTFGFDRNSMFDQPDIINNKLIFGSRDGNVYSINLDTREEEWKFSYGTTWAMTSVVDENTAYIGWSTNNKFCAIDLVSGEEKWSITAGSHNYTSGLIKKENLYFGSADGKLYSVRKDSGQKLWSFDVGSEIYSSPTMHEGLIYFGADDGKIYAIQEVEGHMAVYQPDSIQGNARFLVVDAKMKPFLTEKGFTPLNEEGLKEFLDARIRDRERSIVVFALPIIPRNMIGENPVNGMIREYLNSGGRVLWFGDVPNYYALNDQGNFGRDPKEGMDLLSVNYSNPGESGNYFSNSTELGIEMGLPAWYKSTVSIVENSEDIEPLSYDEFGRISAWIKRFGGKDGGAFISLRTWAWNVSIRQQDLEVVYEVATYGFSLSD